MMNDEKKKAFHEFPKIDGSNFKKISNFEGRKIKNKKFKGCPRKKDFNFKFKNKNDEKKFF